MANIYKENGFLGRFDYLSYLSDEYDVPIDMVLAAAELLGPGEDFDGLACTLEDDFC